MFKALFSSSPTHTTTATPHNKVTKDNHAPKRARSWYFTAPNPSNGQKYTTTTVPIAHNASQQRLSIVVGRNGNVEVMNPHGHSQSHSHGQGQGHSTNTAKHHTSNPSSQPNVVLVSPANPSSGTKRHSHEKHTSAPPPPLTSTLRRVVSNDDRSKSVNNRHSIIGVQRVPSHPVQVQGHGHGHGHQHVYAPPRSDVATTGGSIAPRTVSNEKPRAQSHSHSHSHSHTHAHHGSGEHDDSKKYPKSPHPSKPALPSSRRDRSPENHYHHSERHADGHQSSKHHTSSHQSAHHGHHRSTSDLNRHHASGKENIPSRTMQMANKPSGSHLDNILQMHSQSFLQLPGHSLPQPQPQPHAYHSHSRSNSAEKHVRYLDPTHPEVIPDRTPLRPITAQPHSTSAPIAAAPIAYTRTRRSSMPTQRPISGTYFGDPYADPRLSRSFQNDQSIHQLRFAKPQGWFNRRGDQYIAKGLIKKQPPEFQWHPVFASYPEVGRGWMDEEKKFLPPTGGILKN